MSQPDLACQVVSTIRLPGRYRRAAGTSTPHGFSRKLPAARSKIAANTLGESGRGAHIHSTAPLGAMRHDVSQSDKKA